MAEARDQGYTSSSENVTNIDDIPSEPIAAFIVIGKTGAGKSSFIKLLGGRNMANGQEPIVDDGLESCTSKLAAFKTTVNDREIILLDTPGLDCSGCAGNLKTLNDIASSLYCFAIGRDQVQVRGAIFLHDIGETRFTESQKKTLSIFKSMCGERFMGNVIVGTTMWSPRDPERFLLQQNREMVFAEQHWGGIYKTTRLLKNDSMAAVQIITDLLTKPPVSLLIQDEMLRPPHTASSTTAGRILITEVIRVTNKTHEEQLLIDALLERLREIPNLSFVLMLGIIIVTTPIAIALSPSTRRRYAPYAEAFAEAFLAIFGRNEKGEVK